MKLNLPLASASTWLVIFIFLCKSIFMLLLAFSFPPFFLGDFGEENIELVRSVANLEFAKAVILGNHDAWHTKKFSGK